MKGRGGVVGDMGGGGGGDEMLHPSSHLVKAGDDLRQEQIAAQFFFLANTGSLQQSLLDGRAGLKFARLLSF